MNNTVLNGDFVYTVFQDFGDEGESLIGIWSSESAAIRQAEATQDKWTPTFVYRSSIDDPKAHSILIISCDGKDT